jgi:DNA repair exonuclease SbcCD ATPase subunit
MIHWLAQFWAKWVFVWDREVESGKHVWAAKVAERNAALTKTLIAQMTKEADDMDARVKQMAEMEEKGFWECENGHERVVSNILETPSASDVPCPQCGKPAKFISRATMTGQAIYESDKDRKEAEKLVAARREEIAAHQKDLENQEQTARYFRGQAQSSRMLADNLRKV